MKAEVQILWNLDRKIKRGADHGENNCKWWYFYKQNCIYILIF